MATIVDNQGARHTLKEGHLGQSEYHIRSRV
jgi:hypothetical protein